MTKREIGKQIYDYCIQFNTEFDEGFTADEIGNLMILLEEKVKEFDVQRFFDCHLGVDYHENDSNGYHLLRDRTGILRCAVNAIKEEKKTKKK